MNLSSTVGPFRPCACAAGLRNVLPPHRSRSVLPIKQFLPYTLPALHQVTSEFCCGHPVHSGRSFVGFYTGKRGFAFLCLLAQDVHASYALHGSSGREFAFRFLRTSPHDDALAVPLVVPVTKAHRGLSPPSNCALAHKEKSPPKHSPEEIVQFKCDTAEANTR